MNKIFIVSLMFLFPIFLSGCGHNVATHSKGWGIEFSWRQDSFVPDLRLGYWDVSCAMVKENVELKMKSNAGLSAEAGQTNKDNKSKHAPGVSTVGNGNASNEIEIKTGSQINGYTKDVLINSNLNEQTVKAIKALNGKDVK